MRYLKSVLAFALVVALFTGCAPSKDKGKVKERIKVGITMYNEFDPFTEDIRHNIEENLIKLQEDSDVEITSTVVYSGKHLAISFIRVRISWRAASTSLNILTASWTINFVFSDEGSVGILSLAIE